MHAPLTAPTLFALGLAGLLAACGGSDKPHPPPHPPGPHALTYDVIPLNPRGETYGVINPHGINANGQVTGHNFSDEGTRAFLYDGTRLFEIGTFGGANSQANGINRCGHVTGWAEPAVGLPQAFLYDGTLRNLGSLGGESVGYAVNDCDVVAGWSAAPGGVHAFVHDGAIRDLGSFGGNSFALSINSRGLVAGYSFFANSEAMRPFIYDSKAATGLQDLGTLGGHRALAKVINEAGQVAGWSLNADGVMRAFRYSDGVMADLGSLDGTGVSEAMDMNESGVVVGNATSQSGAQHGFVHDGTSMRDIGTLGGLFSEAVAVNASGVVVGSSQTETDPLQRAVSWTPAEGMVDLNTQLHAPPRGIHVTRALAVSDNGSIAALANTGLVLLKVRR
ncbi:hypothetical protein ACFSQU_06285 [Massilia sp. GCM10020059]|uniref:HAF family extracellular repeat protein n=1 Tax=Massilia agrisoli TaxID=2892444 RepID=A0ABS8IXJ1_9BURK|nr:hypothetical protein [Massilia agrisoli]MCC6073325.1 hypothetical protein [Massilia agrisoli]